MAGRGDTFSWLQALCTTIRYPHHEKESIFSEFPNLGLKGRFLAKSRYRYGYGIGSESPGQDGSVAGRHLCMCIGAG